MDRSSITGNEPRNTWTLLKIINLVEVYGNVRLFK